MVPRAATSAGKEELEEEEEEEGASVERATTDQAHDLPTLSASSAPIPTIIFSCPSKINWFANTVYPIIFPIIFCTVLHLSSILGEKSPQSLAKKLLPTIFFGVEFAILLVVHLELLPYRLEVQSDATLLVRACLRTVCHPKLSEPIQNRALAAVVTQNCVVESTRTPVFPTASS
jgi:hypothetical protein